MKEAWSGNSNWKINTSWNAFGWVFLQIVQIVHNIRDTGPDAENTDHGADMFFFGPLVNQWE
jgi:hypothetical protein